MITPEQFADIVKAATDGEGLTNEQAKDIVTTISEMDVNLVILQNALELAIENAREIIPAVVEKTLTMSGRTDGKSKKKAAKYAAEVTARFEIALQMYLGGAAEQAQKMLYPDSEVVDEEYQTDPAQEEATNE